MRTAFGREFAATVYWAKTVAPFMYRTVDWIYDDDGCPCDGMTIFYKKRLPLIVIRRGVPNPTEVLLHELAHVVYPNGETHDKQHGPKWGQAYARVWREYHHWIEGRK